MIQVDVKTQVLLLWVAVGLYAVSSVLYIISLVFRKDKVKVWARVVVVAGLLPHSAAILLRWIAAGHGPYLNRFEVVMSDVWLGVVLFLFIQWRYRKTELLGAVIMPVSFLVLGYGVLSSPEIRSLPGSFQTYWLVVHILFAKLAYSSCLVSAAAAALYLIKGRVERRKARAANLWHALPDLNVLDDLSYRFAGLGFLFIGVMIIAGSIWANQAWGVFWGWDPIETWSLITWFIYGIYLHLYRIHGWKGHKAAWLNLLGLMVLIFVLFGIGYIYTTNHAGYTN